MAGVEAGVTENASKDNSESVVGYEKKCIFCRIVNREMGTELLYSVRIPIHY